MQPIQLGRMRVHKVSNRLFGGPAFDIVLDWVGGRGTADGPRALRPGGRAVCRRVADTCSEW